MPTYTRTYNIDSLVTRVREGALTGGGRHSDEKLLGVSRAGVSPTGLFEPSPHETPEDFMSGLMTPMMVIQDGLGGEFLTPSGQVGVLLGRYGKLRFDAENLESLGHQASTSLSPVVRRQLEEIMSGVSQKLQDCISKFKSGRPGQELVREPTMDEVKSFIGQLCDISPAVSATLASDGTLSIAADFPGDVRLYVEIERDGSVEAAVTKERRYASDIPGDTIAALTSEVIRAAVDSI